MTEDERVASLDAFRETFSAVPAPVSIVTASEAGVPVGTTVSAFCSLSAAPPLVLVALDLDSNTLRVIRETRRFGINVLAVGQEELALACARKGGDKFANHPWHDEGGIPRLDEAIGWVRCDVQDELPGGDHAVVVGLVRETEAHEGEPLIYYKREFHVPAPRRSR